ncbi:DUF5675 family protein [Maridesulfovibrio sp.]|uniref:DUF5675 family protein n=1 Tax=Maridesulfovibrio sp. TaxID=2795000 RepID=UPI002A186B3C|nr:DUF5675 family protein [Maridesulfovibrio sp.]
MKIVELKRVESSDEATLGVLLVDGRAVCWTLEEPWRDNLPDISCIPAGNYPLMLEFSPSRKRRLWTVKDVPGRSYVRIHTGNTVLDTEGCLLTGTRPGRLNGARAVLGSHDAFGAFVEAMGGGDRAAITVTDVMQ